MSKKQKSILDEYNHKVPQENLLAMINSAIYLQNQKIPNINWKNVSDQVNEWLQLEYDSESQSALSYKYLQKFFQEMLHKLPEGDRYFLVDKINTVKAEDEELYVLVDWKYFPPSNPLKNSNWTKISLVDCDQIYKYLQIESNREKYKDEIRKLPRPYQTKLEPYLDNEFLKQTLYKTQLNKTTLKSMLQKEEARGQQAKQESHYVSNDDVKQIQKQQETIKNLQQNQEKHLSQISELKQQNRIYEKELQKNKQFSSQLIAKLKQYSENINSIVKSQQSKQNLDYSTYVGK